MGLVVLEMLEAGGVSFLLGWIFYCLNTLIFLSLVWGFTTLKI